MKKLIGLVTHNLKRAEAKYMDSEWLLNAIVEKLKDEGFVPSHEAILERGL